MRELTLLAQSAGILCDSTYASLEGNPQLDLSPSELRQCPVLPAEGASAALAAAVEASLPCPLYADEPEDSAWDAAASQQDARSGALEHLAPGPEHMARVRDVHACAHPDACLHTDASSRRRRRGAVRFGLKAESCSPYATCARNQATTLATCCVRPRQCFAYLRDTCRTVQKRCVA